jgi:hypothetical protein
MKKFLNGRSLQKYFSEKSPIMAECFQYYGKKHVPEHSASEKKKKKLNREVTAGGSLQLVLF